MTARQNHGFLEEEYIRQNYSFRKSSKYTSRWDGYLSSSTIENDVDFVDYSLLEIPVSIKTKKLGGCLEMGSLLRNATVDTDFVLFAGMWQGQTKTIVKRHIIYVPRSVWNSIFNMELSRKMNDIFKDNDISNDRIQDDEWKKISTEYRKEWNKSNQAINVLFKRDHKNQRRVQCSIRRDFFNDVLVKEYTVAVDRKKE